MPLCRRPGKTPRRPAGKVCTTSSLPEAQAGQGFLQGVPGLSTKKHRENPPTFWGGRLSPMLATGSRGSTTRSGGSASTGCGHGSLPWVFQVKPCANQVFEGRWRVPLELVNQWLVGPMLWFRGIPIVGGRMGFKRSGTLSVEIPNFRNSTGSKILMPRLLRNKESCCGVRLYFGRKKMSKIG